MWHKNGIIHHGEMVKRGWTQHQAHHSSSFRAGRVRLHPLRSPHCKNHQHDVDIFVLIKFDIATGAHLHGISVAALRRHRPKLRHQDTGQRLEHQGWCSSREYHSNRLRVAATDCGPSEQAHHYRLYCDMVRRRKPGECVTSV